MIPVTLPDTVRACRWESASQAPLLFASNSDMALEFLSPVLGPTSTLLLHRLTGYAGHSDARVVELATDDLAQSFGITRAQLCKSVHRMCLFNVATWSPIAPSAIFVVDGIRDYPVRWLERLPGFLQHALLEWQAVVAVG